MVALMHAFMYKINGEINTEFPVKAMKLFIASESMSGRTSDLVLANLLGPILCTVQRINAKSRGTAIVHCDMNSVKELANNIITMTK